jgi:hypothetical protein
LIFLPDVIYYLYRDYPRDTVNHHTQRGAIRVRRGYLISVLHAGELTYPLIMVGINTSADNYDYALAA